jgi:ParB family transcriptional regulator, chromosome partitioning protein
VSDGKRRALGRGLDALLPTAKAQAAPNYASGAVFVCPIERIVPQRGQPRKLFTAIDELAESIREHGLLEPLVVRKLPQDRFELIAGERRWRAAQKAGLKEVLVVVKDVTPEKSFVLAILENVQREDLNPVELAEAYDRLIREHGFSQETIASQLGKDRSTIANALRLLKLPVRVREKVITGELSEGHARTLLAAPGNIDELAEKVIRGRLSVRATEALIKGAKAKAAGGAKKEPKGKSASIRDLETRLMRKYGLKCEVREQASGKSKRGEVVFLYADLDGLDRILEKLL